MQRENLIQFADGTEVEASTAAVVEEYDNLWISTKGLTMAEAAVTFCDTNKTSEMVFNYWIGTETFTGYVVLKTLNARQDGTIDVCMRRNDNA